MKIAIIACCKCEELYIQEWLDWHFGLGVDHIFLADNNDSDYKIKLESVVKKYIDAGTVTVIDFNDVNPIQPVCYIDIYDKYSIDYDWIYVCDIDEFLHIPKYNNDIKLFVYDYIKRYDPDSIKIAIKQYDDNDYVYYNDEDVQKRFTRLSNTNTCKNGYSDLIKSIFKSKKYNQQFICAHQHDGLMYDNYNRKGIKRINVLGDTCRSGSRDIYETINNYYKACDIAYIAHFKYKTIEEYIKYKVSRGDAKESKYSEQYPYKLKMFWTLNNKTEQKEKYIINCINQYEP